MLKIPVITIQPNPSNAIDKTIVHFHEYLPITSNRPTPKKPIVKKISNIVYDDSYDLFAIYSEDLSLQNSHMDLFNLPHYADVKNKYFLGSVTDVETGIVDTRTILGSVTSVNTPAASAVASSSGISTFSMIGLGVLAAGGAAVAVGGGGSSGNGSEAQLLVVDTAAPLFSSASAVTAPENTAVAIYDATADGDNEILYTLSGIDSDLFTINETTGSVSFLLPPDYENPHDNGSDNLYEFSVTATDHANNSTIHSIQLTIADCKDINDSMNIYEPLLWSKSDGWSNGGIFLNSWEADQITFDQGVMTIELATVSDQLLSGEYRSVDTYGYGFYEISMKASDTAGTINGFFTYTGPSEETSHHEIDIEIKGDDPTKIQLNYWTDGIEHPTLMDLGFDASLAFHTYSFFWQENQIDWYVDGNIVHTENGSNGPLPTLPGKIMTNLWATEGAGAWSSDYTASNGSAILQIDYISNFSYPCAPVI